MSIGDLSRPNEVNEETFQRTLGEELATLERDGASEEFCRLYADKLIAENYALTGRTGTPNMRGVSELVEPGAMNAYLEWRKSSTVPLSQGPALLNRVPKYVLTPAEIPEIETPRLTMRGMSTADRRDYTSIGEILDGGIAAEWLNGVDSRLPANYRLVADTLSSTYHVALFLRIASTVSKLSAHQMSLESDVDGVVLYAELERDVYTLVKGSGVEPPHDRFWSGMHDALLRAVNHPDFITDYEKLCARLDNASINDIDALLPIVSHPLVMDNYIDSNGVRLFDPPYGPEVNGNVWSRRKTKELIEKDMKCWAENGYGRWGLILKEAGALIGYCGLGKLDYLPVTKPSAPDVPALELSFRLHPDYWGKGLAQEAARATFEWGFQILRLDKIYACATATNEPSLRSLRQLGMTVVNSYPYHSDATGKDADFVVHSLRRKEWQRLQLG